MISAHKNPTRRLGLVSGSYILKGGENVLQQLGVESSYYSVKIYVNWDKGSEEGKGSVGIVKISK